MNGMALCAGVGGLENGLKLALGSSYRCVCHIEREAYAVSVLVSRMEDKILDQAVIWDDIRSFDGKPWRGIIQIISAGFPCQPFSVAGRQQGVNDPRHLWPDIARIIGEVRPQWCFFENVPGLLTTRTPDNRYAYQIVSNGLYGLGYTITEGLFSANEVGAPHKRIRLFFLGKLAHSDCNERGSNIPKSDTPTDWGNNIGGNDKVQLANSVSLRHGGRSIRLVPTAHGEQPQEEIEGHGGKLGDSPSPRRRPSKAIQDKETEESGKGRIIISTVPDSDNTRLEGRVGRDGERGNQPSSGEIHPAFPRLFPPPADPKAWKEVPPEIQPLVLGMDNGLAEGLDESEYLYTKDRIRAVGNGVLPLVGAYAFTVLYHRLTRNPHSPHVL